MLGPRAQYGAANAQATLLPLGQWEGGVEKPLGHLMSGCATHWDPHWPWHV